MVLAVPAPCAVAAAATTAKITTAISYALTADISWMGAALDQTIARVSPAARYGNNRQRINDYPPGNPRSTLT